MEYQVHCFHRTGGVCQAGVELAKFIVLNVIYENISCAKLRFKEGNRPINNQPGFFFFFVYNYFIYKPLPHKMY
jgi:hypothetical protein